VVIGDDIELPFEDLINYADFVVRIPEKDVPQLGMILQRLPSAALRARITAMRKVWHRFMYNDVSVPGDAFDTILATLHLRARAFKPVAVHVAPIL
jgi:hypothetical protein